MIKIGIFIFCLSWSAWLHAKANWIEIGDHQVAFELPVEWKAYKDMLGAPLVVVSPIRDKGRVTLIVSPSKIHKVDFSKEGLEKDQDNYRNGKNKWLKKVGGESLKFHPYKIEKWKNAERVHSIGVEYLLGDIHYTEHTYFFNCRGYLYNIKSLYREKEYGRDVGMIKKVIQSFNCSGPKIDPDSPPPGAEI